MPRQKKPKEKPQKPKPPPRGNSLADYYFPLPATVIARCGEIEYRHGIRTLGA